MIKAPKVGKHQLENNYLKIDNLTDKLGSFQKFEKEVYNYERIHISTLAMDFSQGTSKKEREMIEAEWIEKLPHLDNIRHLSLRHRVNDKYFSAICRMKNLESISFWSSTVEDLTPISNLNRLKCLHIDSFSRLIDIKPLKNIKNIEKLWIERCFKIENYEIIGEFAQLIGLAIEGDTFAPKNLILESLKPFTRLKNLKHLNLETTSIKDKSFMELLKMESLIRLDASWHMKKEIRNKIKTEHKSLKSGFFMCYDFENNKFYDGVEWWIK